MLCLQVLQRSLYSGAGLIIRRDSCPFAQRIKNGVLPIMIQRNRRQHSFLKLVVETLRIVWEASDHLYSKRLHPFLPELIRVMRRCGENKMTLEIEPQLCRMSAATIDRLLRPWKQQEGRHSLSTTRPGSLLRRAIPGRKRLVKSEGTTVTVFMRQPLPLR